MVGMMAKKGARIADSLLRIAMSFVLVIGIGPTACMLSTNEAYADTVLTTASVNNSAVVASGSYIGYAGTEDGAIGKAHTYAPKYSWELYESGLLSIALSDSVYGGTPSNNPGWMDYADQITAVEITKGSDSAQFQNGNSGPTFYYSTITKYMFSGLENLVSVNAPYVHIVAPETFANCSSLETVKLGTSYESTVERYRFLTVCSSAFSGCSSLSQIAFGYDDSKFKTSHITISDSAFAGCASLTSTSFIATAGSIGNSAFAGCSSLRSLDLSSFTTSIGSSAFEGCTKLKSITLPESTKTASYLDNNAFLDCSALESVTVPSGATAIPESAFKNNAKLKSVTIPASVTGIGPNAFYGCTDLSSASLPNKLTTISQYAFYNCTSLENINLPSTLSTIGTFAFAKSGLRQIVVPPNVKTVTSNAFNDCDALENATLANGVEAVAAGCFFGCDELRTVNVASSLVTLASNCFGNCSALEQVWFDGDAPTINASSFAGVTSTILYPISNEYWSSDDMQNYGGNLTWTPYGDIGASSLSVDDMVYSGGPQQPITHLLAANNIEVASSLYSVSCYSDSNCENLVSVADVKLPGKYYLRVEGNSEQNCSGVVGPVEFEIEKAPLEISYVSEIVDEGDAPAYKIGYAGFVGGEDDSALSAPATLSTPSALLPGKTYTLTPEGAEADNYEITFVSGTLAVNPRYVDKPACASNLVYTGKDQTAIIAGEGYTITGTSHAVNAGDYSATIELDDGYAWTDGSLDPLTYNWSIGKAQLTAAFVDETIDAYATPSLIVSVTGFVDGETAGSAAGYQAPTASVSSSMKPGYSYTATVRGGTADNYSFTYKSGKVTMNRVVIEPPAATLSFTYNGVQKTAISSGEGYVLTGTNAATDAGSYTATATPKDGYEWSDGTTTAKKFTWTISPATGALSLDGYSLSLKIAESGNVGLRYTGDGTVSATSSDSSVATASIQAGKVKVDAVGEGNARIVVSSSSCGNYTTPASVTLSVSVESIDLSQCSLSVTGGTYTGKAFDPKPKVFLPDGTELAEASSHAVRYYSDSACTKEVAASALKAAGSYWARAEAAQGGRSSGATEAVQFQIEKATLSATYEGEAVEYGGVPQASVKVTGFVGGRDRCHGHRV